MRHEGLKRHPLFLTPRLRGVVDLIVVASVWGVLVALAASGYRVHIERARVAEAMVHATVIKQEMTAIYAETGKWARDIEFSTMAAEGETERAPRVEIAGGAFTAVIGKGDKSYHLTFRAAVSEAAGAPVQWLCGFALPPPGYRAVAMNWTDVPLSHLPAACRGPE